MINIFKEKAAHILFFAAAIICVFAVVLICIFLFSGGIPVIGEIGLGNFIFGDTWKPGNDIYGIFPMIIGSLYVTGGALAIGVPIGVLTAIFMSHFASARIVRYMRPAVQLLAGIPSVVYGFFGLVVIVPMLSGRGSLLAACIVLGIMILPTIISVSESALRAVPKSCYEAALAIGSTHERAVFKAVLPAAKSGVMASVILGVGRAIGEAMAVMMVAGNQARIPGDLFDGVRTLTSNIVIEMGYSTDMHREALVATAVVLFVFVLMINILFSLLKRSKQS